MTPVRRSVSDQRRLARVGSWAAFAIFAVNSTASLRLGPGDALALKLNADGLAQPDLLNLSLVSKSPSTNTRTITFDKEPIELSKVMKFAGLAGSGGEAKHAIREGLVLLNGVVETRKGKKLVAGDKVTFGDETVVIQID